MYAWGATSNGQLGLGGIEDEFVSKPTFMQWPQTEHVTDVACGCTHTLLLTRDGKVASCGNNDNGQLGHDKPRKRPQPVPKLSHFEVVAIACGMSHSMALNSWGQVYAWGCNKYGQLGIDGPLMLNEPKLIKNLAQHHIIQIASGLFHSLALTNNGELFAWGANNYGQLGIGKCSAIEQIISPNKYLQGIPIALIACGAEHSFALTKSGAVFAWGKNAYGQLGLGDTNNQAFPHQLRSLRSIDVRYIACGDNFSTFLSADGGVFTCGLGSCGQLGHGVFSNELMPRKVSELMGSTITQVQCGRMHTLALIPSRNRIYSFGLGGEGQLGHSRTSNTSIPQIVIGPWASGSHASTVSLMTAQHSSQYLIYRIFSGGDHCFASVNPIGRSDAAVYDLRDHSNRPQILTVLVEKIKQCVDLKPTDKVDGDLLTYLETVFQSVNCWNASFLLPDNAHNNCSSKHCGVNFQLAEEIFSMIGKIEHEVVKVNIFKSITENLLPKLTPSPPDVEALRIFLVLPYYHEFNNPKRHIKIQGSFANAVLNLKDQPKRVITMWWQHASAEYFEKLVNMFKSVAAYLIRNQRVPQHGLVVLDESLRSILNFLASLNNLNKKMDGMKVPYDTFYISDLSEYVDIQTEYVEWLTDTTHYEFLCSFPFIFNAQAKTLLLQTDQAMQMETAMQDAARQVVLTLLMDPVDHLNSSLDTFLSLEVSRERLVDDALCQLRMQTTTDLKKPLRVKFRNEEAEDAGGVRKEFFLLLLREILDPKYGMFKKYDETRSIWFSEDSLEDTAMYMFIGQICGLAIYNFTIIDIPFPLALYKKLLFEPIGLVDVKGLSPVIANSLQQLLDYADADFSEVFGLTFEITRQVFDVVRKIELKPNGESILVTQENKEEYVDLYVDYVLNKSVQAQFEAFASGFMKVVGGRVLTLFQSHELMAAVVGNENYDWHALEECTEYKNGYKSSDQVIRWFWEVIHELPLTEKKKFLLYLTGSDRIPIQGMRDIRITIQPTLDEKYLPVAHTCFNLLDLPRYRTKERLKYKLLQAIQQTEGFAIV